MTLVASDSRPIRSTSAQRPAAAAGAEPFGRWFLRSPFYALTLGYRAPQFWNARHEYVYVGEQFGSFDNQVVASADGQKGLIDAYGIWNAVFNYTLGNATLFVAGKNLGDSTYIVDRTRGIQVGMPRTFQAGLKLAF